MRKPSFLVKPAHTLSLKQNQMNFLLKIELFFVICTYLTTTLLAAIQIYMKFVKHSISFGVDFALAAIINGILFLSWFIVWLLFKSKLTRSWYMIFSFIYMITVFSVLNRII